MKTKIIHLAKEKIRRGKKMSAKEKELWQSFWLSQESLQLVSARLQEFFNADKKRN